MRLLWQRSNAGRSYLALAACVLVRPCEWVKEVLQPRWDNALKGDVSYWKLLLSHRQVMSLLNATDVDHTKWYKAVNLRNVWECPAAVPCAGKDRTGKVKQNARADFLHGVYTLSGWPTLLI